MNKVCGCNGCISFFGRDLGGEMLKSPEILTNERKYDRQGAKVCGIFSNFALGLLYLKNTVCHKIGKIAESYQSKTPKQEKRMMQSMLLVFFRKDKGECYTREYGTLSAYFFDWRQERPFRNLISPDTRRRRLYFLSLRLFYGDWRCLIGRCK